MTFGASPGWLYRLDVLGTRAFWTLAYRVGDLLAFMQGLEADALEGCCWKKRSLSVPVLMKPKFLFVSFLTLPSGMFCVSCAD